MITFKQETNKNVSKSRKSKIGVSFNGRQCPAGHNIILGLIDENT